MTRTSSPPPVLILEKMTTSTSAANQQAQSTPAAAPIKMETKNLQLFYGQKQALKGINTRLAANAITALIGPSGCGKSTFLRCLNRMNDLIENVTIEGEVTLEGQNVYAKGVRGRAAPARRHGFPKAKSVSDEHLR